MKGFTGCTRTATGLAVAVVSAGLLSGCFVKTTLKSELSSYAEPTSGDLAHIRLIGSRNVKVYPDSTCVSYKVPGSGYPAGPQMGGQRKRDLGMPKTSAVPRHYVEIATKAGKPIAAGFSFYRESSMPGVPGTGAPGSRSSSSCFAARSFVPQTGRNYEMVSAWTSSGCAVQVYEMLDSGGELRRSPVASLPAEACATSASDSLDGQQGGSRSP